MTGTKKKASSDNSKFEGRLRRDERTGQIELGSAKFSNTISRVSERVIASNSLTHREALKRLVDR